MKVLSCLVTNVLTSVGFSLTWNSSNGCKASSFISSSICSCKAASSYCVLLTSSTSILVEFSSFLFSVSFILKFASPSFNKVINCSLVN